LDTTPEVVTRAKEKPLTRSAVDELAKSADVDSAAVLAALSAGEAHAATVLAYACMAAGRKLTPDCVRALLADVDTVDHFGPLLFGSGVDAVSTLLGFLEDGRGSLHREALALLVVAELTKGTRPPPIALTHARKLCRRAITTETSVVLGGAALRFDDHELNIVAAQDIKRASRSKRGIEETLASLRKPASEVLGTTAAPRVVAGYTVRKDAAVGRNDACPCGSGKKYKKCCALKEEAAVLSGPRIELSALHPEQVMEMRPAELRKLDVERLPARVSRPAFQRALELSEWALAERMLIAAEERASDRPEGAANLRAFLFEMAARRGQRELADRMYASLTPAQAELMALTHACLHRTPDLAERIEKEALQALRDETDGGAGIDLAYTLLQHFPALGIFVARGAMHEGRVNDCQGLLDEMEDARDRLLLPAIEPWWDFYDAMIDAADDRDDRIAKSVEQEKLARELKKARDEKRRATAQLTKLRERLEELDARADEQRVSKPARAKNDVSPEPAAAPGPAGGPSPELEEERRRLRTKVAELRRIIEEGQEERRELRTRLLQAADEERDSPTPARAGAAAGRSDAADDDGAFEDDEEAPEPRGVLVPRFSDRAAKALRELDAASDVVLSLVASLAAGRPNAWSGTKQLKKVRGVLSARAGIHHRILFRASDGVLDIVEVIARKDLEQTVTRLAAR